MTKKTIILMAAMAATLHITAKDIKTIRLTTTPAMHCESCETKIKSNIRFVRGVKNIETDIPLQCVTITYDADKASFETLQEGFRKINYEVKEIKDEKKDDQHGPVSEPRDKGE